MSQEEVVINKRFVSKTLADPGGAHPARAPPNGRGPMIFYAQNAIFSQFFCRSLRSRFFLSLILIEIWPKHAKIDFYFNPSTLSMIFYPPPSLTKSTPPLRSNPGSATVIVPIKQTLLKDTYLCNVLNVNHMQCSTLCSHAIL